MDASETRNNQNHLELYSITYLSCLVYGSKRKNAVAVVVIQDNLKRGFLHLYNVDYTKSLILKTFTIRPILYDVALFLHYDMARNPASKLR